MQKTFTVKGLQKMPKDLGIKTAGLRKVEMIKAIQRTEGNFDCFSTSGSYCDQTSWLFRPVCLK
jgi:hypothetical protein